MQRAAFCLFGALLGGAVAGCGASVPYEEVASARSAVSAAEASGAQEVPQASLHLKMARDGIAEAERVMEDEPEQAKEILERARADAELAKSMTEEDQARREADIAIQRIERLQQSNSF